MPPSKSYLKLGLVVLFLLTLVILSAKIFPQTPLKTLNLSKLTSTFEFAFRSEGLSKIVSNNLQGKEGEYAVYIEELPATTSAHLRGDDTSDVSTKNKQDRHIGSGLGLDDLEIYTLRFSDSFPAASLYKVFLMAAVLKEIENGELRMENVLSASQAHLIDVFGGVDFGYEDAPEQISYTVEEALTRVGRISDNFAAIMLMDKVGPEKVQAMADSLGATSTNIKSPISTSASDMGKFFKALYKGEVVSKTVSDEVIRFLSLNQLNDRIPAGVRAVGGVGDVRVIHKTGELAEVRHDAGIVYLPDSTSEVKPSSTLDHTSEVSAGAYVIVLMSQNLKYEDEGVETLAKISKEVYEYFRAKSLK